jgi:hypothetical protein
MALGLRLRRFFTQAKNDIYHSVRMFFIAGRSVWILISGLLLLVLAFFVFIATFSASETLAAEAGWSRFVAATGTNQWVSATFLFAGGSIVLALNYLPRLEGEN